MATPNTAPRKRSEYTQEEIDRALKMLERNRLQQQKQKEKHKDPKYKEAQKLRNMKKRIKEQLLIAKAIQAGINVGEAEVDKIFNAKYKKG